jgi:hypothetical protein
VAHDCGSGQAERVQEVVHEIQGVVAHGAGPVGHRPGQAMAGQLDQQRPVPGEIGEPGCPHGSGETDTVQQHQQRARPDAEHPQAHLCRGEVDERLLGLQAAACEDPALGLPDPVIEVHALLPSLRAAGTVPASAVTMLRGASPATRSPA